MGWQVSPIYKENQSKAKTKNYYNTLDLNQTKSNCYDLNTIETNKHFYWTHLNVLHHTYTYTHLFHKLIEFFDRKMMKLNTKEKIKKAKVEQI